MQFLVSSGIDKTVSGVCGRFVLFSVPHGKGQVLLRLKVQTWTQLSCSSCLCTRSGFAVLTRVHDCSGLQEWYVLVQWSALCQLPGESFTFSIHDNEWTVVLWNPNFVFSVVSHVCSNLKVWSKEMLLPTVMPSISLRYSFSSSKNLARKHFVSQQHTQWCYFEPGWLAGWLAGWQQMFFWFH